MNNYPNTRYIVEFHLLLRTLKIIPLSVLLYYEFIKLTKKNFISHSTKRLTVLILFLKV